MVQAVFIDHAPFPAVPDQDAQRTPAVGIGQTGGQPVIGNSPGKKAAAVNSDPDLLFASAGNNNLRGTVYLQQRRFKPGFKPGMNRVAIRGF